MAVKAESSERENRTFAFLGSSIFHAILLAILILYRFSANEPITETPAILIDMGGGGDNAAAGLPDEGEGNEPAPIGQQLEDPKSTTPVEEPKPSAPVPTPPASKPSTPAPSAPAKINTPTTSDPNVAAIKKAEEDKRKREQQEEQDRIRRQQDEQRIAAENERRRQQEEADRKRREQEERDAKKGKFGSAFGKPGGTGTGQGNTGKPGNQGIPGGTGDNPFGKSNGTGGGTGGGDGTGTGASVGGGLGGRKAIGKSLPNYSSNSQGVVRVAICVDDDGNVVSAKSTLQGSTTTDGSLRSSAEAAARRWKFAAAPGSGEQCGWIDFNFRLK